MKSNQRDKKENYFQEAKSWREEITQAKERMIKVYQSLTIMLLLCLTGLSLAMTVMINREKVVPFLAVMDKKTGEITTPSRVGSQKMAINWQMVRHFVSNYVKDREAYNFLNLDKPYHSVLAMSSSKVKRQYNHYMRPNENANSPITLLGKKQYRNITIRSISKLPSDEGNVIDVRFSAQTLNAISDKVIKTQEYRATLKWSLSTENKTLKAWDLNPIGFTVTFYDAQPVFA